MGDSQYRTGQIVACEKILRNIDWIFKTIPEIDDAYPALPKDRLKYVLVKIVEYNEEKLKETREELGFSKKEV